MASTEGGKYYLEMAKDSRKVGSFELGNAYAATQRVFKGMLQKLEEEGYAIFVPNTPSMHVAGEPTPEPNWSKIVNDAVAKKIAAELKAKTLAEADVQKRKAELSSTYEASARLTVNHREEASRATMPIVVPLSVRVVGPEGNICGQDTGVFWAGLTLVAGIQGLRHRVRPSIDSADEKAAYLNKNLRSHTLVLDQSLPKGVIAPASGTVPGVPVTGNPSTVVIYRKMSAAEAAKTLDTKQLQPKVPGSNGKKYLSESLDKVKEFENKGVPKGTDEVIVEFTLDKAKYDALLADKVPQKLVGETPGGRGKIEYQYEGLPQDGPHVNIGVPDNQLPGFNGAVIDVRILPPKK